MRAVDDEDRIVQISDPHFGTERAPVVDALVDWVRALRPSLLVLSGDLTQRARRAQFDAARAFVDRMGVPALLAVPGNHDLPLFDLASRLLDPYVGWRRVFGADLEPVVASPRWLAIGVLTTRRWRHVDGAVSAVQAARVAARLEAADDAQLRIVVTHQPALTLRPEDAVDRLHGADAALRRWSAAGADLVLGGHIHLPYIAAAHEHVDGLARRMWIVQAGTAVSHRTRREAGNSVNLLRIPASAGRARGCVVERWDCVDPRRGFERVSAMAPAIDTRRRAPVTSPRA